MGSEKSAGFRDIGGKKCTKSEPKGTKREPTGAKRETKVSQRATKMHKKIEGAFLERFWVGLWAIRALTPDPFGSHFPSKMHPKINAKVDVEKVWKFMRKCSQNHAKTRPKINNNSRKFWNLRFLVFCEEYNVQIVFLHDQEYQKSMNNL